MERKTTTANCAQLVGEYQALSKELVQCILQATRGHKQADVPSPEEVMKKIIKKDQELQKSVRERWF